MILYNYIIKGTRKPVKIEQEQCSTPPNMVVTRYILVGIKDYKYETCNYETSPCHFYAGSPMAVTLGQHHRGTRLDVMKTLYPYSLCSHLEPSSRSCR